MAPLPSRTGAPGGPMGEGWPKAGVRAAYKWPKAGLGAILRRGGGRPRPERSLPHRLCYTRLMRGKRVGIRGRGRGGGVVQNRFGGVVDGKGVGELRGVEVIIQAMLCEKLGVGALLDDFARV